MNSHADHPLAIVVLEVVVVIPFTEKPDDLVGAWAVGVGNDHMGVVISDDADTVAGTKHRPNVSINPII